ncbi:MAG: Mut7-C RNAse domain-containing protein [Candidatus Stygibacter frigidus]|nr:Mut7-C RNAse domain-containing protein [Candidatus Stygibacter frigidus]
MTKETVHPRFLLRENLNKLARELRLLGYDAAIYKQISFYNLCRIAARENRILLTRSLSESKQKTNNQIILIKADYVDQQLRQIRAILQFDPSIIFSRCSLCNKMLYEIDKKKIINFVPEYVLTHYSHFRICRFCGHIYWEGDHHQAILKRLKNLFEEGKL